MRPLAGKDHRNDRAVVGDVESGVCQAFVIRRKGRSMEVRETREFVEESDDQTVDRTDGASGDVVGPVVGLLFAQDEEFVRLVGDYVVEKILSDCSDKFVGNLHSEACH